MDVSQQQDGLSEISSDESGKTLNGIYQSFLIKYICVLRVSAFLFTIIFYSL